MNITLEQINKALENYKEPETTEMPLGAMYLSINAVQNARRKYTPREISKEISWAVHKFGFIITDWM